MTKLRSDDESISRIIISAASNRGGAAPPRPISANTSGNTSANISGNISGNNHLGLLELLRRVVVLHVRYWHVQLVVRRVVIHVLVPRYVVRDGLVTRGGARQRVTRGGVRIGGGLLLGPARAATYLLTHSLTHLLTQSLTHSLSYLLTHALTWLSSLAVSYAQQRLTLRIV